MFDSVLGHGTVAKSRFGTGAVVSVLLHVGVLGLAIYLSTRPARSQEKDIAVVLKVAAAPPPPPPPASSSHKEKKTPKKNQIVQPKEIPKERPPEAEPPKDEDDAVEGGVEGGVKGGVVGGVVGGTLGGTGTGTVAFGEGMTRPVLASSPNGRPAPDYTAEARQAEVEGLMVVRCTITAEGTVTNCQILKPIPHMESAMLQWLAAAKYVPVMFQGHPQAVNYVFNFRFKLEQH
jgi:periplasmic protein TonB